MMEKFWFENYEFVDTVLRLEIFPDDCSDFSYENSNPNVSETDNGDAESSVKVRTLQVSSPVLAGKSPFFYKLFRNGMKESQERNFTLRINVSEEYGLMDVINFIYTYKLRATTIPELLKVLILADKFEVTCCMRYCCDLLLKLPMSLEWALEYLDLPPTIFMDQSTQPLIDAANKYKSEVYSLQENALSLSLSEVEILLASDELRVKSEDIVLEFVNRWSYQHYPASALPEYQETLNSLYFRFVRFQYLSLDELNRIQVSHFLNKQRVSEKVHEALFFKAELPCLEQHQQQQQQQQQQQKPRIYELRPLKLTHFQDTSPHCAVYMDLKKDECAGLFPDKQILSENFWLNVGYTRAYFFLRVRCGKDDQGLMKLGFYLGTCYESSLANYNMTFELAVMMKNINCSRRDYKLLYSSWRSGSVGWEIEWSEFIAEDSPYFTRDIVRFRAELELKPKLIVGPLPACVVPYLGYAS